MLSLPSGSHCKPIQAQLPSSHPGDRAVPPTLSTGPASSPPPPGLPTQPVWPVPSSGLMAPTSSFPFLSPDGSSWIMNKRNIFSSKYKSSLPQPNDYPRCLFTSPFQSQILGGAAYLHLVVSLSLPSRLSLAYMETHLMRAFMLFQLLLVAIFRVSLSYTLLAALSCLLSSTIGSPLVNPGSSRLLCLSPSSTFNAGDPQDTALSSPLFTLCPPP